MKIKVERDTKQVTGDKRETNLQSGAVHKL